MRGPVQDPLLDRRDTATPRSEMRAGQAALHRVTAASAQFDAAFDLLATRVSRRSWPLSFLLSLILFPRNRPLHSRSGDGQGWAVARSGVPAPDATLKARPRLARTATTTLARRTDEAGTAREGHTTVASASKIVSAYREATSLPLVSPIHQRAVWATVGVLPAGGAGKTRECECRRRSRPTLGVRPADDWRRITRPSSSQPFCVFRLTHDALMMR